MSRRGTAPSVAEPSATARSAEGQRLPTQARVANAMPAASDAGNVFATTTTAKHVCGDGVGGPSAQEVVAAGLKQFVRALLVLRTHAAEGRPPGLESLLRLSLQPVEDMHLAERNRIGCGPLWPSSPLTSQSQADRTPPHRALPPTSLFAGRTEWVGAPGGRTDALARRVAEVARLCRFCAGPQKGAASRRVPSLASAVDEAHGSRFFGRADGPDGLRGATIPDGDRRGLHVPRIHRRGTWRDVGLPAHARSSGARRRAMAPDGQGRPDRQRCDRG
jgi:hypothetical protein